MLLPLHVKTKNHMLMKTHLLSFVFVALIATSSSFANNLSLIGDATPGGWSLDSAIVMKPVADGIYEFVGDLKDGSLKFVVQHDFVGRSHLFFHRKNLLIHSHLM